MGLIFSKVRLKGEKRSVTLYYGGISLDSYDLEENPEYQKFMSDNRETLSFTADVNSYIFGDGFIRDACERETADIAARGEAFMSHPDMHWHSESKIAVYNPVYSKEV